MNENKGIIKGLVSVIVPNYNVEAYIQAFLDGMLAQTYKNWELIIVDDKSTDLSPEIVRQYARNDLRIKLLVRQDDNKGACQRRNQGLDAAKGEYVIFFDSDDLIPDDTLEIRVRELQSDPSVDFIVVPAISFLEKPYDTYKLALGLPLFEDDIGMFLKRYRLPFGVWTNIYRKSFLLKNKIRWDEKLTSLQDSDFNIQSLSVGAKYKYADNQTPGYWWRIGGNPNSITKNIKTHKDLDSQLYFYEKLRNQFREDPYRKDVERFGLTLINRFAQCQAQEEPEILFSKFGRRFKYRVLRLLYKSKTLKKLSPVVNLIVSPFAMLNEYWFLIRNRRACKKYIEHKTQKQMLEVYKDQTDKERDFWSYQKVSSVEELKQCIEDILATSTFIFRGVSCARYKMYSSAQRHWLIQDAMVQANYETNYIDFIKGLINKMRNSTALMAYLGKKKLPVNDFLLLSIAQHYADISPMVDFTFNPWTALFFACDGVGDIGEELDSYVSLYYISTKIDWMQASIQEVYRISASNADAMVEEFESDNSQHVSAEAVVNDMKNLRYPDDEEWKFIPVSGPEAGVTKVSMPYLGMNWNYQNESPRILKQEGMFILNTSSKEPLVERMNRVTRYNKLVNCIEIPKYLIGEITEKLLNPRELTKTNIYMESDESKELERIMNNIFPNNK